MSVVPQAVLPPGSVPEGLPPRARRGLVVWLALLFAAGSVLVLGGQGDGAALLVITGQLVAARVADHDEDWALFNGIAQLLTPALGVVVFGALAWLCGRAEAPAAARALASAWCVGAAVISALLYWRPFTNAVTALLLRRLAPNHVERLTARLVVMGLMLPVPALVMNAEVLEAMQRMGDSIADPTRLVASLAGEIVVAFAAVGWMIDRDFRAALRRLGVGALGPRTLVVALLGLGATLLLTAGLEFVQQRWFAATWASDHRVVEAIAADLTLGTAILLGISAGVGEEIAVRGALQPRLGIVLSSLLFAALHVQYSWYGMMSVGLLGVLLGVIRARSNTSAAMLVHVAYDIIAASAELGR